MQFLPRSTSRFLCFIFFFFNDTATTEIYTLSLHDALPILCRAAPPVARSARPCSRLRSRPASLHREDAGHGVEGGDVAEQTLNPQLALHQLHRDASPDVVVVNRHPEQADLEVAQVHDRARLSPNREIALGLQAIVDDKRSLAELERHAL